MDVIRSPDGGLAVELYTSTPEQGLAVKRGGRTVVEPSPIGVSTPDGEFPADYEFVSEQTVTVTEEVRTARGKRRRHDHRATQATLKFRSETGRTASFQVRVAPDGVGYRYRIGGDGRTLLFGDRPEFGADHSAVRLPDQAIAWLFGYAPDHESVGRHYSAHRAAGEFTMPGLFRVDDDWVLVAEAGVDGTYAASRLATTEASTSYEYRMPRATVDLRPPVTTPWRVLIIGDLATVGESSLVAQLVGEAELDPEADWIEPGRVGWSWWSDGSSPADFEIQREYVEYAAERGWEYVLVDVGWDAAWLPDLVAYAEERGVGVFVWAHWTELNRTEERTRRLDRWADWGVAGVKIDFMDADDQGRHQFYDEIMEAAAERELMLNFHGSVVPTGLSSRWPHVMTYEGVMGAEHYGVKGVPAEHNVVLAFTRNVIGPMDYTPVAFSTGRRATSAGHELALSVVFESGLQHFADSPEAYRTRPLAERFLERVSAAWDETVVLGGWPGSEVSIARRRGEDWFVGTITAGAARTVDLPLAFLPAAREAVLIRDDQDGNALVRETIDVSPDETLSVTVPDNGGCCLYLPPSLDQTNDPS
jgi:hypothetical protein